MEEKYDIIKGITFNQGIDGLIDKLYKGWLVHSKPSDLAIETTRTRKLVYDSMEDLTFVFKRNIKQFHYTYQGDLDDFEFLKNSILELELYIRRILTYGTKENLEGLEEFDSEIKKLVQTIWRERTDLGNVKKSELEQIKSLLTGILRKCDIDI